MPRKIQVLLVEDNSFDAQLIELELQRFNQIIYYRSVKQQDILSIVKSESIDVLLTDYHLPDVDPFDVIKEVRKINPTITAIIVAKQFKPEIAEKCYHENIWDFILKDHLYRLIPSIKNAYKLSEERRKKEEALNAIVTSEEKFKSLSNAAFESIIISRNGICIEANHAAEEMFYYEYYEFLGKPLQELFDQSSPKIINLMNSKEKINIPYEIIGLRKDGSTFIGQVQERIILYMNQKVRVSAVRDITIQKEHEKQLKNSQARYFTLFNESPIGILEEDFSLIKNYIDHLKEKGIKDFRSYFNTHPDEIEKCIKMMTILAVNKIVLSLHEVSSKQELIDNLITLFQMKHNQHFLEELIIVAENKLHFEGEFLHKKLGGEDFHVYITWQVAKGYEHSLKKILVSIIDITKRKQAELEILGSLEEKKIMLKEIHHRVKNNMQIVSSLLKLQSRTISDEGDYNLFIDSHNRVKSMALVHEKLYHSANFASINFNEYVQTLLRFLTSIYSKNAAKVKFIVTIPPLSMNMTTAIPVGLILNEIISICLKKAFSPGTKGEIKIDLHWNKVEYDLKVIATGKKLSEKTINSKQEIGFKLINALASQLHSEVKTDFSTINLFSLVCKPLHEK